MQRNPSEVTLDRAPRRGALAWGDRVGVLGSVLCALHCALLPLLIAALPALGLGGLDLVDLDQGFTVFASLLGVSTLAAGYRRHRAFHAWAALIPGLAMIWIASFSSLHDHSLGHVLLMVSGGLMIAAAHAINLRLSHAAPAGFATAASRG
jgi:hypothetical protein